MTDEELKDDTIVDSLLYGNPSERKLAEELDRLREKNAGLVKAIQATLDAVRPRGVDAGESDDPNDEMPEWWHGLRAAIEKE